MFGSAEGDTCFAAHIRSIDVHCCLLILFALVLGAERLALGIASATFVLGIASDVLERRLFFQAEAMPSMPGVG